MKNMIFLVFIALLNSCNSTADVENVARCAQNADVTIECKNPYFGINYYSVHQQHDLKWYSKIIGDTLIVKRKYSYNFGGEMIIYKFLCRSGTCPVPINIKAFKTISGDTFAVNDDEAPPIWCSYNGFSYRQVFDQVDNFDFKLQEYVPNNKFVVRVKTDKYETVNGGSFCAWDAKIWIDLSNMNDF